MAEERQLLQEREVVREKIRDANFADESMEMRIERRERQWGK